MDYRLFSNKTRKHFSSCLNLKAQRSIHSTALTLVLNPFSLEFHCKQTQLQICISMLYAICIYVLVYIYISYICTSLYICTIYVYIYVYICTWGHIRRSGYRVSFGQHATYFSNATEILTLHKALRTRAL